MRLPGSLLLVGCGKMGGALLDGWLKHGAAKEDLAVIEPHAASAERAMARGVRTAASTGDLGDLKAAVLVVAVKPQMMAEALPGLAPLVGERTLVVSIAAGTPVAAFERAFGPVPVVRVMPNTPAAIGRGISALFATPRVDPDGRALAEALMAAVGETVWLDDEEAMHAVTGLSGGGPAYVFHMIEALAVAGEAAGLEGGLARRLARATVAGAGALLEASPDEDAAVLRQNVTSKGGTTAAALAYLMAEKDGLTPLMRRAVAAAASRSRELGED